MSETERFISENIEGILSHSVVKAKTGETGGTWSLNEIYYIHGMPSNIEFGVMISNGTDILLVSGKINRQTASLSNIKARVSG